MYGGRENLVNPSSFYKRRSKKTLIFWNFLSDQKHRPKHLSLRGRQAEILRSKSQLGNVAIFWIEQTERQLLNISFFPA